MMNRGTRVLRLTRNLVALRPLWRSQSDGGIAYTRKYQDDKLQWLVINMSEKAWRVNDGHVQNGDHVIVQAGSQHAHEFEDSVILTDAKHIVAVVSDRE